MNTQTTIIKGYWWQIDAPEQKAFGELEITVGAKAILTVYSGNKVEWIAGIPQGATIHGHDEQDKPVTLLRTLRWHISSPAGVQTVKADVGYVLRGIHVRDKDTFSFKSFVAEFQHLYGWLGLTGFDRTISMNPGKGYDVHYVHIPPVTYAAQNDLVISFGLGSTFNATFQERNIQESAWVSFERGRGFSLTQCLEIMSAFASLLHFSNLKAIYPVDLTLSGVVDTEVTNSEPVNEVRVQVSHFKAQVSDYPVNVNGSWIFQFNDLRTDFGDKFTKWLDIREKYAEALSCYTTTVYHTLPVSVENLCLTQALDAYHGAKFASHDNNDFKKKIGELYDICLPVMTKTAVERDAFITKIHETRNYFTHHNPYWLKRGNVATAPQDLIRLNAVITILFQACILSEFGIPKSNLMLLRRQLAYEAIDV